ncbi:MAG: GNAT family N-acetyltransferase [Actinomycetota bacterium]
MAIAIRQLGLRDSLMVEELLDHFSPGWSDALAPTASGATAFLAARDSFIFGAYDDHDAAGWLWGVLLRRPDGRREAYVHELDVEPTHRRRGIATMLVGAAMELARQESCSRLWLITRAENGAGRGLYESLDGRDGGVDDDGWRRFVWQI